MVDRNPAAQKRGLIEGLLRHKILTFALIAAVLTDVGLIVVLCPDGIGADFVAYSQAAHSSDPYALSSTPFANPPTALLLLQLLRTMPLWPAYIVVTLAGLALYFWFGRKLYGSASMCLALVSPAVILGAIPGQLAVIEAALVFLAFASPPIAGAAVLAVAAGIKPQMVLMAPVAIYIWHGWKPLLAFICTTLLLAALATFAFGLPIWSEWLAGMRSLVTVAAGRHALLLAVSPLTFLARLNDLVVVGAAVLTAVGAYVLYRMRWLSPPEQAAVLVACSLVASPYALSYDLVALTPLAAALLLRDKSWRGFAATITFTAACGPLTLFGIFPSIWRVDRQRG
jgi:hypothetical protein